MEQFVLGLASGFYVDTEGLDDQVDGLGVRYQDGKGVLLTDGLSKTTVPEGSVLSQTIEFALTQPASQAGHLRTTAASETAAPSRPVETASQPSAQLNAPASPGLSACGWSALCDHHVPAILFMAAAAVASDYRRF